MASIDRPDDVFGTTVDRIEAAKVNVTKAAIAPALAVATTPGRTAAAPASTAPISAIKRAAIAPSRGFSSSPAWPASGWWSTS